jgi:glycosyltransferase involved in cell wall biosynthesis
VVCGAWTKENRPELYDPDLAARGDFCETNRVPLVLYRARTLSHYLNRVCCMLRPYKAPWQFYNALRAGALKRARQGDIAAVWSTALPGLNHTVGAEISRRFRLPWVADFRDLPDQTYDTWRTRLAVRAEVRTCSDADALTATTDTLARRLASRHTAPVFTITNGFDPDDYPEVQVAPSATFNIRYFGKLYEYRDPRVLLEALDLLAERGALDLRKVRVEFYGTHRKDLAPRVAGHRCAKVVQCKKRVARAEMVRLQQQAAVLLLLKSSAAGGSIPAKLFEYLGARRPILNVPGDGDLVDGILEETGAGCSNAEPSEAAEWILRRYNNWMSRGTVPYHGKTEKVFRYSRSEQARVLAAILDEVCAERSVRYAEDSGLGRADPTGSRCRGPGSPTGRER